VHQSELLDQIIIQNKKRTKPTIRVFFFKQLVEEKLPPKNLKKLLLTLRHEGDYYHRCTLAESVKERELSVETYSYNFEILYSQVYSIVYSTDLICVIWCPKILNNMRTK
jgi:hypothetical protein